MLDVHVSAGFVISTEAVSTFSVSEKKRIGLYFGKLLLILRFNMRIK